MLVKTCRMKSCAVEVDGYLSCNESDALRDDNNDRSSRVCGTGCGMGTSGYY